MLFGHSLKHQTAWSSVLSQLVKSGFIAISAGSHISYSLSCTELKIQYWDNWKRFLHSPMMDIKGQLDVNMNNTRIRDIESSTICVRTLRTKSLSATRTASSSSTTSCSTGTSATISAVSLSPGSTSLSILAIRCLNCSTKQFGKIQRETQLSFEVVPAIQLAITFQLYIMPWHWCNSKRSQHWAELT